MVLSTLSYSVTCLSIRKNEKNKMEKEQRTMCYFLELSVWFWALMSALRRGTWY